MKPVISNEIYREDLEKYKSAVKEIEARAKKEKDAIAIKFANDHSPVEIGDIVSNNYCTIKVEKIRVEYHTLGQDFPLPRCIYSGVELLKNGTPNKKGKMGTVYQSQMK